MDPRLQAEEFMDQLLAAHQAEDALVPALASPDEEE
jgi:hypothetical protein